MFFGNIQMKVPAKRRRRMTQGKPAKRRRRMTQGKPPLVQAARRIPSGLIGNLIFKLLMQISFQKYIT